MDCCHILLYCNKHAADNPYYCSNVRLFSLITVIERLSEKMKLRILRIGGGHRTPLKHNCEAEIEVWGLSEERLEEILKQKTEGTEVCYAITSKGKEVSKNVE